jgi:hypothetical protein
VRPEPEQGYEECQIGEAGLEGAIGRIDAARNATPSTEIAATEALWWCSSLDAWHQARLGVDYFSRRGDSDYGQVVAGLVYARNLSSHQLALVPGFVDVGRPIVPFEEVWDEDLGEVVSFGLQPVEIRWQRFEKLPVPPSSHPERHGRDQAYESFVAGRPLVDPLRDALMFFRSEVWA